ncbi:MAG: glycosyltransferase family 4 protein [Actinomycetota bacterium]
MRVGLIAPPWLPVPPPSYGGIEEVVDALARGLTEAGHAVTLFTTGDSTCPVERRHIYPTAVRERLGWSVPELYHVVSAYRDLEGCDIVHDHTVLGPLVARDLDRLVVTTNHGPFTPEMNAIYRWIDEDVPIVAVSHHHASGAEGVQVARVIHHGLDHGAYTPGQGEGGYALFLGRMAPEKGVDRAIRIARAAGLGLLIAAKLQEPSEIRYFREVVEPTLGDDAVYLGEVDRNTKRNLLPGAVALLNPIAWPEPFGLVMIEALASGTPVVAFPRGSAPEIVEDGVNGFLRDDEDSLVEALRRVDEIDRGEVRRTFEERFTSERMVREHIELYEEVIGRQSRLAPAPLLEEEAALGAR